MGGATEIYIESFVKGNFRLRLDTILLIFSVTRQPAGLDGGGGEEEAGGIMRNVDRERERDRERGGQVHNLLLAGAAFYLSSFHRQQGSYRGRARGLS